jgi:hypothetical protein
MNHIKGPKVRMLQNVGLFLSVLSLSGGCGQKKLTVAEVDERVGNAVPAGTERARLLAVLDSPKMEHSDFDEKTRTIATSVPDNAKTGIVTRGFHLTFNFDSAGKLVSHAIRELFTGP